MVQRHVVAVAGANGAIVRHALKAWLRDNPDVLPGIDPTAMTSHQLRNMLRKAGWRMEMTESEVILIEQQITAKEADALVDALVADDAEAAEDPEDAGLAFELEYQLRDFLIANLGSINIAGKHLRLYSDESGRSGREYPTAVGLVDILAQDENGSFYVLELKRARTSDHAVGQVLRYMGWVKAHLAGEADVHGVLVARQFSDSLRYAVSMLPDVSALEYEVSFRLRASPGGPVA